MARVDPRLDTASPTVATPDARNAAMESVVPAGMHARMYAWGRLRGTSSGMAHSSKEDMRWYQALAGGERSIAMLTGMTIVFQVPENVHCFRRQSKPCWMMNCRNHRLKHVSINSLVVAATKQ